MCSCFEGLPLLTCCVCCALRAGGRCEGSSGEAAKSIDKLLTKARSVLSRIHWLRLVVSSRQTCHGFVPLDLASADAEGSGQEELSSLRPSNTTWLGLVRQGIWRQRSRALAEAPASMGCAPEPVCLGCVRSRVSAGQPCLRFPCKTVLIRDQQAPGEANETYMMGLGLPQT